MNKSAAAVVIAFFAAAVAARSSSVAFGPQSAPQATAAPRVDVEPANVAVFAGAAVRFHARIVGDAAAPGAVSWEAFGAGAIDDEGRYQAPPLSGTTASIVATIGGSVGGARLSVVEPPPAGAGQAIVACYDDGELDVRGTYRVPAFGRLLIGDSAGDVAVDEKAAFALATSGERAVAIDLATMTSLASAPSVGARFGEVVLLAGGAFAAATNENAGASDGGVAIFRLKRGAAPQLTSTARAGETPEGIAVDADGRTMYVTAVNGNVVTRLVLNDDGSARTTGSTRTGTRPFGIAVDSRRNLLIVADNDTPTLSGTKSRPGLEMFSLPSMRRIGDSIATGTANALPLGVAVDPAINRVFVTNEGDDDVVVYALPSLHRVASLPVGRTPWLPSIDTHRHLLYVPNARDDTFEVFDTRTLAHVASKVGTCSYPVGVAVPGGPAVK
ncbi:MAG TPA: SMP-30/gluconolactonase/LRE family protein [Candidatus Eremiobacteraceae bacterium]